MVADELRRQADEFVDLTQMVTRIGRDPGERAERAARQGASSAGPWPSRDVSAAWRRSSQRLIACIGAG